MLGKLMKYELKATQRIFLPLYGLIFILALLNKLFMTLNLQHADGMAVVPFAISITVYCLLIAAVFIMTLVVTVQRFNKNLLGDEGYLSFTLPVKVRSHIVSKMIISLMWTILSGIVAILSVIILAADSNTSRQIQSFFQQLGSMFCGKDGFWGGLLLIELIAFILLAIFACILQFYASVTVGHFSSRHKLLAGFGAFIGFGIIEQIVSSILVSIGIKMVSDESIRRFWNGISDLGKLQSVEAAIGVALIYEAVFGLAFYFLTNWLLSDKLNLE